MKNLFLISIMFFTSGCVSADAVSVALKEKYEDAKAEIHKECIDDAAYIQRIAQGRDLGITREEMTDWILDEIGKEQKAGKLDPSVTSADVLHQVLLVIWIYSNSDSSPEDLFRIQFKTCTSEQMAWLDIIYEAAKKQLKKEKD